MQLLTEVQFGHQKRITVAEPFTFFNAKCFYRNLEGREVQSRKTIYMRLSMWENLVLFLWAFCWDIINLTCYMEKLPWKHC